MFVQRGIKKPEQELELLDVNMTNISNELSELVVSTASQSCGSFIGDQSHPIAPTYTHCMMGAHLGMPYQQEQYPTYAKLPSVENLYYSYENFYRTKSAQHLLPYGRANEPFAQRTEPPHLCPAVKLTGNDYKVSSNVIRDRRASAPDTQHVALLCAAVNEHTESESIYDYPQLQRVVSAGYDGAVIGGARKKNIRTKLTRPIDYDNVVIDLKAIGLNTEKEDNEVLRLFNLMYKLNFYLNDQVPFEAEVTPMDYPCKFEKPKALMPFTMNVQTQLKHCIFKSNSFCFRTLEKLDEFKFADHDKYFNCNRCIFLLRVCIKQLEPFKSAEFEHRHGKFVHSFSSAQAKNLEILLNKLIDRVRECNVLVEVYRWSIKRNIKETGLPSIETLRKAIAIASAIKTVSNEVEAPQAAANVQENDENNINVGNMGNGGGFAAVGYLPVQQFNTRGRRFVGL